MQFFQAPLLPASKFSVATDRTVELCEHCLLFSHDEEALLLQKVRSGSFTSVYCDMMGKGVGGGGGGHPLYPRLEHVCR